MSAVAVVARPASAFPYWRWERESPGLIEQYRQNQPVPHILLKDFLEPDAALAIAAEFPAPNSDAWTHYRHHNEDTLGLPKREQFPRLLGEVVDELNSPAFLRWVSQLTGIEGLVADPSMEGGGLHQSGRGGFLNIHTDFSHHHYHKHWRRRVNLILYLNAGWQNQWGGAIELWDAKMQRCVAKYPPFLNHALIFQTDEKSFHGFPEPLTCPEGDSRKSLALYYYTIDQGRVPDKARSTDYRARPGDGIGKSALIWLDKKAVDIYSRAKARFGFSDDLASKALRWFSGKK